jgi:hypothetical protein
MVDENSPLIDEAFTHISKNNETFYLNNTLIPFN